MNNSGQQRRLWVPPGPFSTFPQHHPTDAEDTLNTYLKTTNLKGTSNCYPPQGACAPQFGLAYPKVPSPGSTGLSSCAQIQHTLKQGFLDSESDSATLMLEALLPSQRRGLVTETQGWGGSQAHKCSGLCTYYEQPCRSK